MHVTYDACIVCEYEPVNKIWAKVLFVRLSQVLLGYHSSVGPVYLSTLAA